MLVHSKLEYMDFKHELIKNYMVLIITAKSYLHFSSLIFQILFIFSLI